MFRTDADMPYRSQPPPLASAVRIKPRIIIHGGAGNILREHLPPDKYQRYRSALLAAVRPAPPRLPAPPVSGAADVAGRSAIRTTT